MKKWEEMEERKDAQIAEIERQRELGCDAHDDEIRLMEEEHAEAIAEIRSYYSGRITEYEADLNAANSRLHLVQEELRRANEAWAVASAELSTLKAALTLDEMNLEGAYDQLDEAKDELRDLRGQLARIRAAEEPLRKALYPATAGQVGGALPGGGLFTIPALPFPYTANVVVGDGSGAGANAAEVLEDKVDHLVEAGYACATQKRERQLSQRQAEQHRGYSGLVA